MGVFLRRCFLQRRSAVKTVWLRHRSYHDTVVTIASASCLRYTTTWCWCYVDTTIRRPCSAAACPSVVL